MIIYNAEIYSMTEDMHFYGYVEVQDGKITAVEQGKPEAVGNDDIDAGGGWLLPGLIDAHTHLGIIEDGIGFEGDDCNEISDPFTPQLRALDGINPYDRCFAEIRASGITSVVVSPGSANACGGEMLLMKTMGRCTDEMAIKPCGMKFALGENPKSVYHDRDESPVTRMATASLIREGLQKAKLYAERLQRFEEHPDEEETPEFDAKCEALLPLLEGDVKAHFHCHRADDVCTAARISKEFGLDFVIIHGTGAHIAADLFGEWGLNIIVGPLLCDRCKPELRDQILSNAAILHEKGCHIAICTDHPEVPGQYLRMSAAIAVKGGLPREAALRAITSEAADIIGASDRIGRIAVGLDADLVLFRDDPLDMMQDPEWVMIDGHFI
ncbi:MAG: amidohydrolase family protein [Oscillospiraceae bacterium]|nr:amidohydrolase family protein [Oscillospiraceae bacterium]